MEELSVSEVEEGREARARARWILSRKDELERRYARLKGLLTASGADPDVLEVDLLDLELAIADLGNFLKTACPDEDEDADDYCLRIRLI
mgnify:CR=1 FL=1